jgi:hypothetical protein
MKGKQTTNSPPANHIATAVRHDMHLLASLTAIAGTPHSCNNSVTTINI